MKNLVAYTDSQAIDDQIYNLWRTEEFRASHKEHDGYIRSLVDLMMKRPLILFEMDDPKIEWSHFTTWMGAYSIREYESDAIHDLYYLHEFMHGATMQYNGQISFTDWHRKMCENEMLASTHSEALVYFKLEGLREKSFDFEIWVDRYLPETPFRKSSDDDIFSAAHRSLIKSNLEMLILERKKVMTAPDPFDFIEMQIHFYAQQNMQWSTIWKDNFQEVEAHMEAYLKEAETDPEKAVKGHLEWLSDKIDESQGSACMGRVVTPYQYEAERFNEIVQKNKERQGNEILTK